jgi:hypothetical protein
MGFNAKWEINEFANQFAWSGHFKVATEGYAEGP